MHDCLGIGLIALGLGLAVAGVFKHRSRQNTPVEVARSGQSSPSWVRSCGQWCCSWVGLIGLKMSLFYFVFGGDRFLTPLDYWRTCICTGVLLRISGGWRPRNDAAVEHAGEVESVEVKSAA